MNFWDTLFPCRNVSLQIGELGNKLDHLAVSITNLKEVIMATSAEHAQQLRDLKTQNEKARAENAAAFKKLQDALDAAGGTTPEVDAAMADLKASIQADDDEHPDEPGTTGSGGPGEPTDK